jgi:hypothetical protein
MLYALRFSVLARKLTFLRPFLHHFVAESLLHLQLSRASCMFHKAILPLGIDPDMGVVMAVDVTGASVRL